MHLRGRGKLGELYVCQPPPAPQIHRFPTPFQHTAFKVSQGLGGPQIPDLRLHTS